MSISPGRAREAAWEVRGRAMRRGLSRTFLFNTTLRSPEFLALPATVRGWWLSLQSLCSSQENGGRLVGAARWPNGAWQSALGAGGSKKALQQLVEVKLAAIDGNDVVAADYDIESEAQYQARRANGRKGGQASAAVRAGAPTETGNVVSSGEVQKSRDNEPSTARPPLKLSSSALAEEGEAKKGEAEPGNARGSGDPEGAAEQGTAPAKREKSAAPFSPEDTQPKCPEAGSGRGPSRSEPPDPLGALDNCLRSRSGSSATDQERRALKEYCASLQDDQAVDTVVGRLWAYWKQSPGPTVDQFLSRERSSPRA
jgi:hypothetical protein